jgi:hypothetical protein
MIQYIVLYNIIIFNISVAIIQLLFSDPCFHPCIKYICLGAYVPCSLDRLLSIRCMFHTLTAATLPLAVSHPVFHSATHPCRSAPIATSAWQ